MSEPWGPQQQPHEPGQSVPEPPRRRDRRDMLTTWGIVGAIVIVICVTVAALTSGDDSSDTPASSTATTWSPLPPASTRTLDDADINRVAMLMVIRDKYPKWRNVSDERIVSLAESACDALRAGSDGTAVGLVLATKADLPLAEAGYVTGAMVTGMCPDQEHKLPGRS